MRTTLDIDDDVLQAAKELAQGRHTSTGKVLSELARMGLVGPPQTWETKNGVPLFPVRTGGQVVTMELVNRLRDEAP